MVWPLFKRNMLSGIKIFVILFAVICMYTTVIIYMYNPDLAEMLSGYQQALPEMMTAVGMTGIAGSLLEWIQIYLYGFIMNLFPMIFVIIIVNSFVMRYIDRGGMASLLSTPHSRFRIILTQAVSAAFMLVLLLAAVTGVGILSCQFMFPGELDISRYIQLNASEALLQLIILAVAFAAACISSESKQYYTFGAGIPILFFLLTMLSNMGGKLENLKYCTVYTLFPAREIVQGTAGWWVRDLVMGLIALVLFGGGILWFRRRDLSL